MPKVKPPKLPQLLERKIYKSGQTRGADDDEIYQNRVGRNSTALIRYDLWRDGFLTGEINSKEFFENGYIVLISPEEYFAMQDPDSTLRECGLELGNNCLIFYQQRQHWDRYNPDENGLSVAINRQNPLGGEYVARVHATTATENGERISRGFNTTGMKGAGIRVYEYAPKSRIDSCRLQLEAVYWLCENSIEAAVNFGMKRTDAEIRKEYALNRADECDLLDFDQLHKSRIIDEDNVSICPLCLERLDAFGFFNRKAQAKGREKFDLTITQLNLFHIQELRPGVFNHRPYNLGWGHHLCNVVIGDEGIDNTVKWMHDVVERNVEYYQMAF